MPFSTFLRDFKKWPFGNEGPLVVNSGQTFSIQSGSIRDFESITVHQGGVIHIYGPYQLTALAARGPIIINGTINCNNTSIQTENYSPVMYLPDGTSLSAYSGPRNSGGSGGHGGRGGGSSTSQGYGGVQQAGRGGGGGGGAAGGGGGGMLQPTNGQGITDETNTIGGDGQNCTEARSYRPGVRSYGGAGGGCQGGQGGVGGKGGDRGGGGGGGGFIGAHGLPLIIKTWSSISGSGDINLNGRNGNSGGYGGHGASSKDTGGESGCGGGGGGGGAGGNGGKLYTYAREMTFNRISLYPGNGGYGRPAGQGPYRAGYPGSNGSNGNWGSHSHTPINNS